MVTVCRVGVHSERSLRTGSSGQSLKIPSMLPLVLSLMAEFCRMLSQPTRRPTISIYAASSVREVTLSGYGQRLFPTRNATPIYLFWRVV